MAERHKSCARCGKKFPCLPAQGCWCEDITLQEKSLQYLHGQYGNCLCPNCLKAFESKKN